MTEYVATGHMTRFQCLGGACEDTCCKAWDVPVSAADHARLTGALGKDAADALVTRIPNGRGGTLTVLAKLPDRACPELDDTHLCRVHAKLGESALPDVCASYPRVVGRLDDRLELTGHISCPEVARSCLLADDGALVPAEPPPFGRANVRLKLVRDGAPPYFAAFETVRDAIVELCIGAAATPSATIPFASRLYAVAELATKLAPFYHREATTPAPEQLAQTLADFRRPELLAELHDRRNLASPMDGLALQAVFGMLYGRADAAPAFARVVAAVASTHGEAAGAAPNAVALDRLSAVGPEQLWRTHMARRPKSGTAHADRLDRYLARYSRNYWLQDWYPVSETLFEHAMHLVLRVALVRFLLVGHPGFGADRDDASCDRAVVEVVYAAARAYDHNSAVRAALSATLHKRGMLTLAHCAAMLKL